MALPSAQLGQMSNINVPSYIPKQVVHNAPPMWQQALIQMLAQAGGQAAGAGVQNAMTRDFASEFGDKNASGIDKFFQGPKVNAAERSRRLGEDTAMQRDQFHLDADRARQQAAQDAAFQLQTDRLSAEEVGRGDTAAAQRMLENLRNANAAAEREKQNDFTLGLEEKRSKLHVDSSNAINAQLTAAQQMLEQMKEAASSKRLERTLDAEHPGREALTEEHKENTRGLKLINNQKEAALRGKDVHPTIPNYWKAEGRTPAEGADMFKKRQELAALREANPLSETISTPAPASTAAAPVSWPGLTTAVPVAVTAPTETPLIPPALLLWLQQNLPQESNWFKQQFQQ